MDIKLQDFAKELGITDRQLQKHLKNNENELEGHFVRHGRGPAGGTTLDEYAQDFLRGCVSHVPMVMSDAVLTQKYEMLRVDRERIIEENNELYRELDQYKSATYKFEALEEKLSVRQAQIDDLRADKEKAEHRADEAEKGKNEAFERLLEAEKQNVALKAEIEKLKNRSIFDILLKK